MIQLEIFSDLICPWCYIGKARLDRALERLKPGDVEITWQPYQLNPAMPAEGMPRRAYLIAKFGGAERATQAYQRVEQVATEETLPMNLHRIDRTPNTLDAHRAVRFAAGHGLGDAMTDALFRAYFVDARDIGDHAAICDYGETVGVSGTALAAHLESERDAANVREIDGMARAMGINGVPAFIFNRRYVLSGAQEPEAFQAMFELARMQPDDDDDANASAPQSRGIL